MSKNKQKAVFIITSPFQAICAVEAALKFKIKTPVFILLQGQKHEVNKNTKDIFELNNINEFHILVYNSFLQILKQASADIYSLNLNKNNFDFIFLGDFFSPLQRIFATNFVTKQNRFIFLDDGNSTIEAYHWGMSAVRFKSINIFIKTVLTDLIFRFKRSRAIEFFSIFPNESNRFLVTPNLLQNLKTKIDKGRKSKVFVLGSSLYNLGLITKESYFSYLEKINQHILMHHPKEEILYCPHRGESEAFVNDIRESFPIKIYRTKATVEMDFILNKYNPIAVYSFGSTASFTIKILFSETSVYSAFPKTKGKNINRTYSAIEKTYTNLNIHTIH